MVLFGMNIYVCVHMYDHTVQLSQHNQPMESARWYFCMENQTHITKHISVRRCSGHSRSKASVRLCWCLRIMFFVHCTTPVDIFSAVPLMVHHSRCDLSAFPWVNQMWTVRRHLPHEGCFAGEPNSCNNCRKCCFNLNTITGEIMNNDVFLVRLCSICALEANLFLY